MSNIFSGAGTSELTTPLRSLEQWPFYHPLFQTFVIGSYGSTMYATSSLLHLLLGSIAQVDTTIQMRFRPRNNLYVNIPEEATKDIQINLFTLSPQPSSSDERSSRDNIRILVRTLLYKRKEDIIACAFLRNCTHGPDFARILHGALTSGDDEPPKLLLNGAWQTSASQAMIQLLDILKTSDQESIPWIVFLSKLILQPPDTTGDFLGHVFLPSFEPSAMPSGGSCAPVTKNAAQPWAKTADACSILGLDWRSERRGTLAKKCA